MTLLSTSPASCTHAAAAHGTPPTAMPLQMPTSPAGARTTEMELLYTTECANVHGTGCHHSGGLSSFVGHTLMPFVATPRSWRSVLPRTLHHGPGPVAMIMLELSTSMLRSIVPL